MQESDVIIVGSGQAAPPLATRFARAGRRVVLFEAVAQGGTCINTGCTPTKAMIASARAAHVARTAGRLGVHARAVEVDLAQIVDRKDGIVRSFRAGIEASLAAAGERIRVVRHHARFVGERTLEAGGERYRAPLVILDVGARPATPRIEGLSTVSWLDNASLMALRRVPDHLVVLGGGYVGCEMAQMFRRFGARVTIINSGEHLLGREDGDIAAALEGAFTSEGIDLALRSTAVRVAPDAGGVAASLADGRDHPRLPRARRPWPARQHRRSRLPGRGRGPRSARQRRGGRVLRDERAGRVRRGRRPGGPAVHAHVVGRSSSPLRHPHEARRAPQAAERAPRSVLRIHRSGGRDRGRQRAGRARPRDLLPGRHDADGRRGPQRRGRRDGGSR